MAGTGTEISSFSIAVNKEARGEREKETYFFDCTAYGKTAAFVNAYMRKGSQVFVAGSLQQDRWKDKTTGANRHKVQIIANQVTALDKKSDKTDEIHHTSQVEQAFEHSQVVDESEIPF